MQKTENRDKYCSQHEGETKRFFCETCCTAVCPDCCALDPSHQGHKFIRLEDARNNFVIALQVFIKDFEQIQTKYSDAILQTESVTDELQQSIQTVNDDLEQLKEHYMTRLEATFEKHRNEVHDVWVQRSEALSKVTQALEGSMTTLQTAYDRAKEVIDTGWEYEIIAAYATVSAASKMSTEPSPPDPSLGSIRFEANRFEITSMGHLTSEAKSEDDYDLIDLEADLKTLPPPSLAQSTANRPPSSDKSPSSPDDGISTNFATPTVMDGNVSTPLGASNPAFQPDAHDRLGSFVETSGLRRWKPSGHFKTSPAAERPKAVAIHANGDIAVTSRKSPMTVFSKSGDVKCIQKGSLCNANDIAISAENQYIITGNNEIKVYLSKWFGTRRLFSFPTFDINNRLEPPSSVGVDSCGRIIVAMHDGKTVSIHQPDGTVISMIETSHCPRRLAVTANDELVITFDNNSIQVLSQLGHTIRTIQPPSRVDWIPWYICCSKNGQVLVSNQGNPKAVFMYIFRDGEYRITDCLLKLDNNGSPFGITLSKDERELFVVDRYNNAVRKFQTQ